MTKDECHDPFDTPQHTKDFLKSLQHPLIEVDAKALAVAPTQLHQSPRPAETGIDTEIVDYIEEHGVDEFRRVLIVAFDAQALHGHPGERMTTRQAFAWAAATGNLRR